MEGEGSDDFRDQPVKLNIKRTDVDTLNGKDVHYHGVLEYTGEGYNGEEILIGGIYNADVEYLFKNVPIMDMFLVNDNAEHPNITIIYDPEDCKKAGIDITDNDQLQNIYWGRIAEMGQIVPQKTIVDTDHNVISSEIDTIGDYALFYHKE